MLPFFPEPVGQNAPLSGSAALGVNQPDLAGSLTSAQPEAPAGPAPDTASPAGAAGPQDVAELSLTPTLDPAMLAGGAPDRVQERTPDDLHAFVQSWWTRTDKTPEWDRLVKQYDRDTATLLGMPLGSTVNDETLTKLDATQVTTQHVYRNSVMATAMTLPRMPEVSIEPERGVPQMVGATAAPMGMVPDPNAGAGTMQPPQGAPGMDPMAQPPDATGAAGFLGGQPGMPAPGMPMPAPQLDQDGITRETQHFAMTCEALIGKLLGEADSLEALREYVQDSFHYEVAWLKVTFQDRLDTDLITEERLPDDQDLIARARMLSELYDMGEFDQTDAQYRELSLLLDTINQQVELKQERGLLLECVPATMVRVDPRIRRPGDWHRAAWIAHDVLMTREEVLSRYREINPDDLKKATVQYADGRQSREVTANEQVMDQRPQGASVPGTSRAPQYNNYDYLLVREIHARQIGRVITLVAGLEYPARIDVISKGPRRWYQLRPIILNPAPAGARRLAGLSNTELQSKLQDELNRKRTDRERAVRAAEPRFIYDSDIIEDDVAKGLCDLPPHGGYGVSFGGKDIRTAFLPLIGAGQINPELYRLDDTRADMRSQSGIPESLTGSVGTSKFASENNTAAEGANILADYYQAKVSEALNDVITMGLELVVLNMTAAEVADLIPNAYWPIDPNDRWTAYRKLNVKVSTSLNGDVHKKRAIDALTLLRDTAVELQTPINTDVLMSTLARLLGLPIDVDELLKLDPNTAALKLIQAIQQSPNLDPQIAVQLEAALGPIVQRAIVQMSMGAGGPNAGGPGGRPGRGGPGGRPAPGAPAASGPSGLIASEAGNAPTSDAPPAPLSTEPPGRFGGTGT